MEYFAQVKTIVGATKRYRALAKKWHPDRNGSVGASAVMAEINKQYKELLIRLERLTTNHADSELEQDQSESNVGTNDTDNLESNGANKPAMHYVRTVVANAIGDYELYELENVARDVATKVAASAVSYGMGKLKSWINRK